MNRLPVLWSLAAIVIVGAAGLVVAAPPPLPITETETFLDVDTDRRAIHQGDRLSGFYGGVLKIESPPGEFATARDFADDFLLDDEEALGVVGVDLVFVSSIVTRGDKFEVFTYEQQIGGLPVHGTMVKIPVLLGTTKKLGYVGVHLVDVPNPALPAGTVTAQQAIDTVDNSAAFGHLTTWTAAVDADEVFYETEETVLHRTWRFDGWDDDEAYQFFVDTASGDIVGAVDQIHRIVEGTVTGYATPNSRADIFGEMGQHPTLTILKDLEVKLDGTLTAYTDENGVFTFANETSGTLSAKLIGRWAKVLSGSAPFPDLEFTFAVDARDG